MKIIRFSSLPSTNKYCELLDLAGVEEFTVIWALEQTAGVGQRGSHWSTQAGQNLTFSLILHPRMIAVADQFMLTEVLSLGVADFLKTSLGRRVDIKWPNDIYIAGRKICGMLVENRIETQHLATSICGIGINVNQIDFPSWIPNPTSMRLVANRTFYLEKVLSDLVTSIERRYNQLREEHRDVLHQDYLAHLLNINKPANYIYRGSPIQATITGLDPYGRLQLQTNTGETITAEVKELEWQTRK